MEGAGDRLRRLRERVLTEPSLAKLIAWLTLPLVLSTSIGTVYEIVDTFWLSLLGKEALGVPPISWPYPDLLFAVVFGLSTGISSLVGQYIGAGRFREASEAAGTVLGLAMLIAVPGSLAIALTSHLYLKAIRVPPEVYPLAHSYLVVLALSTPLSAVFMLFSMMLSAAGDTRTPMYLSVASTLVNMVLDPILMFGLLGLPALGVLGAALATAVARGFSAAYSIYSLATGRHGFRIGLRDMVPKPSYTRTVVKVSAPVIAERMLMTGGFMVMAGVVSGLGTPVLAAYSIGQVIMGFDRIIIMPLGRAVGIIVAQSLGAGMLDRAKAAARLGVGLALLTTGTYSAVLVVFAEPFASIFTRDPVVLEVATTMVRVFGPSITGFSLLMVANTVARSSGHTLLVSVLGFSRLWLLRIPLSWLLAYALGLGHLGLWTGMAVSNYVTGGIAAAWTLRGRWARPLVGGRGDGKEANQAGRNE